MSELDRKLAEAAARNHASAAVAAAASPLRDAVEDQGVTRAQPCPCGTTFEQVRFGKSWLPTQCDACLTAENEARLAAERLQQENERRAKALETLDVPLLYKNATLETFAFVGDPANHELQGRVMQRARRFLGMWESRQADDLRFPQVVIFAGAPGTGKGHVAWAIARTVAVDLGDTVKFTVLSDCVRDLREAWRTSDGPSENARLHKYRSPALLIIDEVSSHAFRGEPTQHLYDLIAWREQRLLPTILTTNEDKKALAALLGPALVSRAAGWDGIWDFGSIDYRVERRRSREVAA